ncbi:unnamed protein product [Blepharisma stoltei]|uniref:EGF-like domain-containing protein n=1 Tax=Blepharisma stoltei TaxID=1481888 RepID=A0AAU9JCS6_9CILI|nr:unnamed protein product [Blepharisma stoltei]
MLIWLISFIGISSSFLCGVNQSWKPNIQGNTYPGRSLASSITRGSSLSPIRIYYEYLDLGMNSTQEDQFKNEVMSAADNFFTNALSVYPVSETLLITISDCNGAQVPSDHKKIGVDADYVLYIYGNRSSESFIARAGACARETGGKNNPVAGSFEINLDLFWNYEVYDQIILAIHEMTHALVFSDSLYTHYVKSDGTQYASDEVTTSIKYENRGKNVTAIVLPTVLAKAKSIFNCDSLKGVELEDYGDSGSAGSHWDMRILPGDYMSPTLSFESVLSDITLALFQDSGWYTVNFDYAQKTIWGNGEGCDWFEEKCIEDGSAKFPGFCTVNDQKGCDVFHLSSALCAQSDKYPDIHKYEQYFSDPKIGGINPFADYCPYMYAYSNKHCRETTAMSQPLYYGEKVGFSSRCIESTLLNKTNVYHGAMQGICYEVLSCTSTYAVIQVGSETTKCPFSGGNVTVDGYNGVLICPDSNILCREAPCLHACRGQGKCVDGVCNCNSGFGGDDCEVICNARCLTCTSDGASCASCYSNATLSKGDCVCDDGYVLDTSSKSCVKGAICLSGCKTCFTSSDYNCETCKSGTYLLYNYCSEKCPYGFKASKNSCVPESSEVFDAIFDLWKNSYPSDNSDLTLYFGSSSAFMPNPDANDPILMYNQGLFYTGKSYALFSPNPDSSKHIILSPSHSASFWIRPNNLSDQTILHKFSGNSTIELKIVNKILTLDILLTNIEDSSSNSKTETYTVTNGNVTSEAWQMIAYFIKYDTTTFSTAVSLQVNSDIQTNTIANAIFLDSGSETDDKFVLGAKYSAKNYQNYYAGFIASAKIYNTEKAPSYSSSLSLSSSVTLTNCNWNQCYENDTCHDCLSTCTYGCLRTTDCVLSLDANCADPTGFDTCDEGSSCDMGSYPIITMCIIVFLWTIMCFIFLLLDRKAPDDPDELFKSNCVRFFRYHLFISQFLRQPSVKRSQMTLELMTVLLVELAVIGAMHYQFDNATSSGKDGNFEELAKSYDGEDILKAVIGIICGEVVAFLLGILNTFPICISIPRIVSTIISIGLSILSVVVVIYLDVDFCAEYSAKWIVNFVIVAFFELFVCELLIAILFFTCFKIKTASEAPPSARESNMKGYGEPSKQV